MASEDELRDMFAAAIMGGLCGNSDRMATSRWEQEADYAYDGAEAMLAERAKRRARRASDATANDAAKKAIAYVLRRVGDDVDFADIMLGTQSLRLLTESYDALWNLDAGSTANGVQQAATRNRERRGKSRRESDQERLERLECERDWYRSTASDATRARCDEEMRQRFSEEGES